MKHPDETVQTSAVQLAKRRKYEANIDALIADYERLRRKEQAASRKADDLAKSLGAMRRARDTFRTRQDELGRENQLLKDTLRALRGSRSLKVGRMITKPGSALRALPGKVTSALRPAPPNALKSGAAAPSQRTLPLAAGMPLSQTAGTAQTTAKVTVDYNSLVENFQSNPSKGALYRLISHEYFARGDITLPAARIAANRDLLGELSDVEARVVENILGQAVLMDSAPFMSPRQPNYGYTPERGRVMYCAHSTGKFNSNGYSTRTAGLVAGLKAHNEDVYVVARPGYPWDAKTDVPAPGQRRFETTISGVRHAFNPGPSWSGDRLDHYLAQAADIFVREAQRSRAAVIHSASNYVTALPALMAARRLGVPFIYEVRGFWEITELSDTADWADTDRFRLAAGLEALVVREADEVLAITGQVKDELIRRGADPAKITLLPNSVDTEKFTPMPPVPGLREKLGIAADAVVVGYAGSLVAYEGLSDLLSSMKIVAGHGVKAHLVVVGDGKQLPLLKGLAHEIGITDSVSFVGRVPAKSIPDYVSIFDIMPCPRRRLPVTEMVSPLKPLEAMASGKAVILTDLAPLRDIAGLDQGRALLCEPGDPESLAAALIRLAEDPALRISLGRRARLWTIDQRTWARAGEIATAVHQRVQERSPGDELSAAVASQMRIGIISDQFTFETLAPEAQFIVLKPETWREQLQTEAIDALFVESAWEGTEGLWRHKVGFYGNDEFSTLRSLLAHCNGSGVPTIFWNKEDPVHFNRFRLTAKHFDHVFTTDADCIDRYWQNAGSRLKTVASLPFYAQPRLHNILPSRRKYEHTVSYAGSFYGEKYPKRSAELSIILKAATSHGLAIYDRQHLNPESPYHFPAALGSFVRGGLAYPEMVEAYKAHPVHINVNSVGDSPTMFSRRVMEVAASGGAVVSGRGRGVEEVLNGLIPVVNGQDEAMLLLSEWMANEETRIRDAWLAYRLIHRGHTAAHRLAYVLRTAGLVVRAPEHSPYAVFLEDAGPVDLAKLNRQSVRPQMVFSPSEAGLRITHANDFEDARGQAAAAGMDFLGTLPTGIDDRTAFEDLLTATAFGRWSSIGFSDAAVSSPGLGLAQPGRSDDSLPKLDATSDSSNDPELSLRRPLLRSEPYAPDIDEPGHAKTVLIAGHDLKFAAGLVEELKSNGHTVVFDRWLDHNKHDEAKSRALLQDADIVFCEWALGNAVWYSRNKLPHQRLVARVHSQEIFRPYLKDVEFQNVDVLVFVGRHIMDIAVRDHGVPRKKAKVIPNPVGGDGVPERKADDARFRLGLVGIVPAQKHLDKALDVLKGLRAVDNRYQLFVKGKRPEEFAWMANRPEEMSYYEQQYLRIAEDTDLRGAVFFDPHGDDMADWYGKIGVVLSVSDFESFHLTLADGAAAGAFPVSLAWPGADHIYPTSWLAEDVRGITRKIETVNATPASWRAAAGDARAFVLDNFNMRQVLPELCKEIVGNGDV